MQWFWEQYLGEGGDGANPDASPSQAGDLRRLPRAIVVTAEADVLRDEAESYAQRLFLSTVETEGYRYDGMVHGFLRMAGKVERSNAAFDELAPSIRAMLEKTWRD
jgi:acetyl esterase